MLFINDSRQHFFMNTLRVTPQFVTYKAYRTDFTFSVSQMYSRESCINMYYLMNGSHNRNSSSTRPSLFLKTPTLKGPSTFITEKTVKHCFKSSNVYPRNPLKNLYRLLNNTEEIRKILLGFAVVRSSKDVDKQHLIPGTRAFNFYSKFLKILVSSINKK